MIEDLLQGPHLLILLLVMVLLFGAKRLPETARGLGRSLRIFKAEMKGLAEEAASSGSSVPASSVAIAPSPAPPTSSPPRGSS